MSLLPCITQANPNVALYGSGGGGGGGSNYPANASFSTITMNGPVFMAEQTISLATSGQYQVYASSNDSNMYLVCASTNQIRIGTQDAADSLYIGSSNVTAKYNLDAPQINQVSSINGAVYPPPSGGYTATKINWLNAGSNVLPPTMPSSQVLTSATTPLTNGHTYRVTAAVGLSNSGLSGSTSLFIEGAGSAVGGLPVVLYQDDNLLTAGSTPWYGYTTYFTCSGGGATGVVITGQNSGTSNTTVLSDQGYFIFEDMGAI